MAFKDLTGQTFGKLEAKERVGSNDRGAAIWLCECQCGNGREVIGSRLTSGTTKSCIDCRDREKSDIHIKAAIKSIALPYGQCSLNKLYSRYKVNARKRHYSFKLSNGQFEKLVTSNCYYCGIEPLQEKNYKRINGIIKTNGVDRINNNVGYELTNCVACCTNCNYAKNSMTVEDFKEWIIRIYNNFATK